MSAINELALTKGLSCRKGTKYIFFIFISNNAEHLFNEFNSKLKDENIHVETGVFGADMDVSLINDGPVTIILESKNK